MRNQELAKLLYEIADMYEIQGVQWKPNAYRKAAQAIETMSQDIAEFARGHKLTEIPGVGESIAEKIAEWLAKGKITLHEELKRQLPIELIELTSVPGLGPKKAKRLYDELRIRNLEDLKKAASAHLIRKLRGFGEKSESEILHGIELLERSRGRAMLGYVLEDVKAIVAALKKHRAVGQIEPAGSVRRWKETIGDIDILVTSTDPKAVMDHFTSLPYVEEVLAKGETKSSVRLKNGLNCDLRVVEPEAFGAALQYFTGSKEHNIATRRIANEKGWKLSEYGLFEEKSGKRIAGRTEEEIYRKLGLAYIEPELRENTGEIEAAREGRLPKLIEQKDIRGEFHVHTKITDGVNTIEEMAEAAKQMGYEYLAISDHTGTLYVAHGLDDRRMREHMRNIEKAENSTGIRLLKGAEVNITKEGELDLGNAVLAELDVVIAAVHSHFNQPRDEITRRILRALDNEHVDIFAHPTGRLIGQREPYNVDLERVIDFCVENKKILEINAFPDRTDLNDEHIRLAKKKGALFAISTDSHSTEHLRFIELGVHTARRGWLEKKDVINCLPLKELEKKLGL
ncbi:MAG: DNA polymerase/3'-5' exonuclease PolX [Candidatus Micrarchaeia archaeon]